MANNQDNGNTDKTKPESPVTPPASQLVVPPKTPEPPSRMEVRHEGRSRMEIRRDSDDIRE